MNSLSWLLYGANVASNLGPFLGMTCFGAAIVAGGAGICTAIYAGDGEELPKPLRSLLPTALVVFVVTGSLATLVPSKNTIMLIAASEVGEQLVASPDVQAIGGEAGALATDSLKLLRKYVTEQLGEEKAK